MSEDAAPIVNEGDTPVGEALDEQARDALKRTEKKLVKQIEDALDNGGKKTIRHLCEGCGRKDLIEIEVVDIEAKVKALSAVSAASHRAQSASKGEDASAAATKLLRDRSALTDAELADYILSLEASLADQ